jgi:hypothetical protein
MKRKLITRLFAFATDKFLRLHGWTPEGQQVTIPIGGGFYTRAVWSKTTIHPKKSYEVTATTTTVKVSTAEAIRRTLEAAI